MFINLPAVVTLHHSRLTPSNQSILQSAIFPQSTLHTIVGTPKKALYPAVGQSYHIILSRTPHDNSIILPFLVIVGRLEGIIGIADGVY